MKRICTELRVRRRSKRGIIGFWRTSERAARRHRVQRLIRRLVRVCCDGIPRWGNGDSSSNGGNSAQGRVHKGGRARLRMWGPQRCLNRAGRSVLGRDGRHCVVHAIRRILLCSGCSCSSLLKSSQITGQISETREIQQKKSTHTGWEDRVSWAGTRRYKVCQELDNVCTLAWDPQGFPLRNELCELYTHRSLGVIISHNVRLAGMKYTNFEIDAYSDKKNMISKRQAK